MNHTQKSPVLSADSKASLGGPLRGKCLMFSEASLTLNARNALDMTIPRSCHAQTGSEKAKGNEGLRTNIS